QRVGSTERGTHVSWAKTSTKGVCDTRKILGSNVVLTTEIELTPRIASQAQRSVTTEQTIALLVVTGGAVKTTLQLEYSAQAVTQVFRTLQSPAVTRLKAVANAVARVLRLIASGVTRLRMF